MLVGHIRTFCANAQGVAPLRPLGTAVDDFHKKKGQALWKACPTGDPKVETAERSAPRSSLAVSPLQLDLSQEPTPKVLRLRDPTFRTVIVS